MSGFAAAGQFGTDSIDFVALGVDEALQIVFVFHKTARAEP
jgi:hypothetical protein